MKCTHNGRLKTLRIASKDNIIYLIKTSKEVNTLQDRCFCDGVINTPGRKFLQRVSFPLCSHLVLITNGQTPPDFDSKQVPVTTIFKISKIETEKRKLFNLPKVDKWTNLRAELCKQFLNTYETNQFEYL